jgi:hypothetical protein
MALRSPVLSFALVLGGFVPCRAQLPSGPATLEKLVNEDGPASSVQPAADANQPAAESDRSAARPQGTLVRPRDGVQHPDLDKAWTEYDAAVATAIAPVTTAITKQFEAAVAKGDLDAAEHWQAAKVKFEENGELPEAPRTKAAVSAAVEDCKSANNKLIRAYEAVVKTLTTDKKLAEAKAVQNESTGLVSPQSRPQPLFFVRNGQAAPNIVLPNGWSQHGPFIEGIGQIVGRGGGARGDPCDLTLISQLGEKDFVVDLVISVEKVEGTAAALHLIASGEKGYLGLDGASKTLFVEGSLFNLEKAKTLSIRPQPAKRMRVAIHRRGGVVAWSVDGQQIAVLKLNQASLNAFAVVPFRGHLRIYEAGITR